MRTTRGGDLLLSAMTLAAAVVAWLPWRVRHLTAGFFNNPSALATKGPVLKVTTGDR